MYSDAISEWKPSAVIFSSYLPECSMCLCGHNIYQKINLSYNVVNEISTNLSCNNKYVIIQDIRMLDWQITLYTLIWATIELSPSGFIWGPYSKKFKLSFYITGLLHYLWISIRSWNRIRLWLCFVASSTCTIYNICFQNKFRAFTMSQKRLFSCVFGMGLHFWLNIDK